MPGDPLLDQRRLASRSSKNPAGLFLPRSVHGVKAGTRREDSKNSTPGAISAKPRVEESRAKAIPVPARLLRGRNRLLTIERLERREQLVGSCRKVTDARAGRIMDGVDHGRARTANAHFPNSLAIKRAAMGIVLIKKDDLHLANISVDDDVVAREILSDE